MKIVNEPSILESTFIKVSALTMPHRIVLRKLKNEWVTHCENLEFVGDALIHHSFYNGNYFFDKDEAMTDFLERSKKQGFG